MFTKISEAVLKIFFDKNIVCDVSESHKMITFGTLAFNIRLWEYPCHQGQSRIQFIPKMTLGNKHSRLINAPSYLQ